MHLEMGAWGKYVLTTDRLVKELNDILTHHVISTRNLTKANLNDQAVLSELFCAEFFSVLLGVSLKSANVTQANSDSIDLIDEDARVAIQVTFREDRAKVEGTLKSFREHGHFKKYGRLYFVILGHKPSYRKPFDIDAGIPFDEKEHILSLPQIIQRASTMAFDSLQSLVHIANQYLPIYRGVESMWGEVGIDFAVLNRQVDYQWSRGSSNLFQRLSYRYINDNDVMIVTPHLPYLDLLDSGEPIPGLRYWNTPFVWDFPSLDVKVVNRSATPIFISEANFLVSMSKPDVRPIPVISHSTYDMHLGLRNAGWGAMRDVRLSFNLIPIVDKPKEIRELPYGTYQFSKEIGEVSGSSYIDLREYFEVLGVDAKFLRSRWEETSEGSKQFGADGYPMTITADQFQDLKERSLGPFFLYRPDPESFGFVMSAQGAAQVFGEIAYKYDSDVGADGSDLIERSIRFSTIVWVSENRPAAPLSPSFQYEVSLMSQGVDYEVPVPLSQVIAPNESDRFTIRVAADRSSVHNFSLQLKEAGGEVIATKQVRLHMITTTLPVPVSPPSPSPPLTNEKLSKPSRLVGTGKAILF